MACPVESRNRRGAAQRRWLAFLGVVFVLSFAASCSSQKRTSVSHPLLPYHGRFSDDPRLSSLITRLLEALDPAAANVSSSLGLPVNPQSFRYRLRESSENRRVFEQHWARTLHLAHGPAIIELEIEPFLLDITDLLPVLAHELAHASMAGTLGSSYHDLPQWLQEGLAVHAAGQSDDKVRRVLRWSSATDTDDLLDGIHGKEHTWKDYAEDALAIDSIIRLGGDDAVVRLLEELVGGIPWKDALEKTTGMEWGSFSDYAKNAAAAYYRRQAGTERSLLGEGRVLLADEKYEMSIRALAPLVLDRDTPYHLPALFYSAQAHLELGDFEAAEGLFDRALASRELPPEYYSKALYHSSRALNALGRTAKEKERCDAFLVLARGDREQKNVCRTLAGP